MRKELRFFIYLIVTLMLWAMIGAMYYLKVMPGQSRNEQEQTSIKTRSPKPIPPPEPPLEWNTYHGDNTLTGYAAESVLPDTLRLLWMVKTDAPVSNPPAIQGQRLFCVTSHAEVIAISLTGQRLWSKELFTGKTQNNLPERERTDAPLACFEGLVYVGTMRGSLYALSADTGEQKWKVEVGGPIGASPNFLSASGTTPSRVYVIERAGGILFCIDAQTGNVLWRSEPVDRCESTPGLSRDAIVFGSCAAALHVFSPDTGNVLQKISIDPDSQVAGGVAVDGTLAVSGSRSGKIVEADLKTGKILWANTDSKAEVFTTPAITDQWVIVGANDNTLYALDRKTGILRWKFDAKGQPASPVIAGDKIVVAAEGTLYLLKLADGALLWSTKVSDTISSPAVTRHEVYVGSEDGAVYAFGPESGKGS